MPSAPSGQDRLDLALSRELRTGERVLWQGRQLARISRRAFGIYLFAIPWTAFALFWTAMASWGASEMASETGWLSWAFPAFGLPFIAIGIGMMSAPFLPLLQKGKVIYAVTDRRLLKIKLGSKLDIESIPARRISHIERSEGRDGCGSLRVAVGVRTDSDGDRHTQFFEIGEVPDVLTAHDQAARIAQRAAEQLAREPSG